MWSMIAVVVTVGVLGGIASDYFKNKRRREESKEKKKSDLRLDAMEERIRNLETLVLEKDKTSKYDSLK